MTDESNMIKDEKADAEVEFDRCTLLEKKITYLQDDENEAPQTTQGEELEKGKTEIEIAEEPKVGGDAVEERKVVVGTDIDDVEISGEVNAREESADESNTIKDEKADAEVEFDRCTLLEKKIKSLQEDENEAPQTTQGVELEKGKKETEIAEEPKVEGDAVEERKVVVGTDTDDVETSGEVNVREESADEQLKGDAENSSSEKVKDSVNKKKDSLSHTKDRQRKLMVSEMESITPFSDRPTREKKVVDRYSGTDSLRSSATKAFHIEKGSGTPLKDNPNVFLRLSKKKVDDDLKSLHTILFGKKGKANMIKKNIGQFSGFVWTTDEEKQKAKVLEKLEKCHRERLLNFCYLLNVQINKSFDRKEEIAAKILEFLESPQVTSGAVSAESEKKSKKKKHPEAKHSNSVTPAKRKVNKSGEKKKLKATHDEEKSHDLHVVAPPEAENESQSERKKDGEETFDVDNDTEEKTSPKPSRKKRTVTRKKISSESSKKKVSSSKRPAPEISDSDNKKKKVSKSPKSGKGDSPIQPTYSKERMSAKRKNPEKNPDKYHGKANTGKKARTEPTREEMQSVIADILKEVDFNTATLSDILTQLNGRFSVDLMHRKSEVKEIITEVINNTSDEEDDG